MPHIFGKRYSTVEISILVILSIVLGFVYAGLFRADPYALKRFGSLYKIAILWGTRIGIPLLAIGAVWLYNGIRAGRVSPVNIGLAGASLLVTLLLLYPIASSFYSAARIESKIREYHPFLQLNPPAFDRKGFLTDGFQVAFLGGSTTEFEDSNGVGWPDRVQKLFFNRFDRKDVKVFNLGRQWYTTLHTLINYEVNIRDLKPDMIVVMHNINDLLQNADFSYFSHGTFREDYGHFYGPVDLLITGRNLFRVLWERIDFWWYKPRKIVNQTEFPGLVSFERNLNAIIDLAEKAGTRVVLMTQPYILKSEMTQQELEHLHMLNTEAVGKDKRWSTFTALKGMEAYNEMTRRVSESRTVPLIDLEKAVPKSLEYFSDEVHYKDRTFDLVAEYIAEKMMAMKLL
ncbi:MAG: SGNH/GDSL hydrolase family protein [Deltaproteobacteria bacterium]|nr:SGNH/GDSL hydrolase family protein [Deltaproteobacteria bacterium]